MLANHTSIGSLFRKVTDQYDRLRKRNAFLDQYKKESMFSDGLGEFDDARSVPVLPSPNPGRYRSDPVLILMFSEVAQTLIEEYKACKKPDYIVRK